jgi:hypothetical protein
MISFGQAFPLRPQRIFIAGASMLKRVFINGLIKFARYIETQEEVQWWKREGASGVSGKKPPPTLPSHLSKKNNHQISLFVKAKVLGRIEFAELDRVLSEVPIQSAPAYVGGEAGGNTDILLWTQQRLEGFAEPKI